MIPVLPAQTYTTLPERFYVHPPLSPVIAPQIVQLNTALAGELGLDCHWLRSREGVAMLSGNAMPEGVISVAQVYAGHQFGQFVPKLGDGRAMLLGSVTDQNGHVKEIQLKGAGRTRFSRSGDGRAALGPVLREYIVSEAMAALGVPTTRALAAVTTGQPVYRETPLPGAVLTRVASGFIRVGTFQFFAAQEDFEGLRLLTDYALSHHYPEASHEGGAACALLREVIASQCQLLAQWMLYGFVHGVMNTDNMAISGETIDYGPCAFMEHYDPDTVFSFIDKRGRYAYGRQPEIGLWNLTRLAEALLPVISEDRNTALELARAELAVFEGQFQQIYLAGLRQKLGLQTAQEGDAGLVRSLFEVMQAQRLDYTATFRSLSTEAVLSTPTAYLSEALHPWAAQWQARLAAESLPGTTQRAQAMQRVNPLYIPRNHLVEEMITQAVSHNDMTAFEELLAVTSRPFEEQPGKERYARPAEAHEQVQNTFCGT